MAQRLRALGTVLGVFGLIFLIASGMAFFRTQDGANALQKFSAAQDVQLSYNEDGELVDRGTTEGAEAILTLLEDEWGYPINHSELDSGDQQVNTATEYMYQMATISYHVLHGTQTVVLDEDVEYDGEVFAAGTYDVPVDGRYWTDFDRRHPLEGPARGQAWSGTVHGLIGELGVGVAANTSIQMGYALAGVFAGMGAISLIAGLGLFWASKPETQLIAGFPEQAKEGTLT